ncbi:amastin-like protein [Angomonas deanei]|nr:amastin-like protein [Angomonas deanei]|eukprot:EPY30149.1 amastin-like protein [Angomonas deanei]
MGCVANILFAILEFCAMALVTVGTPLDQLRTKSLDKQEVFNAKGCLNYWGYKTDCYGTKYEAKTSDNLFIGCDGRQSRFKAASACAIIAICCLAVGFVLAIITCSCSTCCPCCKYILMLLSIAGFVTAMIAWAIMLDAYLQKIGSGEVFCTKLKEGMNIGTGWVLTIVGSAVALVNAFVILIPC